MGTRNDRHLTMSGLVDRIETGGTVDRNLANDGTQTAFPSMSVGQESLWFVDRLDPWHDTLA